MDVSVGPVGNQGQQVVGGAAGTVDAMEGARFTHKTLADCCTTCYDVSTIKLVASDWHLRVRLLVATAPQTET